MSDNAMSRREHSRRNFLLKGAAAAAALPALAALSACGETKAADVSVARPDSTPKPAMPSAQEKADAMDAMHGKGIKAFPARTEGRGNQVLKARIEKGWKQKELAQAIGVKESIISSYESGKAIPENAIIASMEKALGTKLPRPPKIKF